MFTLFSCTKDVGIPDGTTGNPECASFNRCDHSWGVNNYDAIQCKLPCINPNNSNEFVFLYTNSNSSTENGIYVFDIGSGSKMKLTSKIPISQPKWGKNGWILFCSTNGSFREIYKIKSNGDSLKNISSNNFDLFPEWDNSSNRIIFNRQIYLGSPASKIIVTDVNGGAIDSINNQYFNMGACNSLSELALPPFNLRSCGISVLNISTQLNTVLNQPSNCAQPNTGIAWHPNNIDIYYTTYYGSLFKLNKSTKQQTTIKSFCDTKAYSAISIFPNSDFALVERIDGRYVDCAPWYKSSIYKISLDGKTESKINIE